MSAAQKPETTDVATSKDAARLERIDKLESIRNQNRERNALIAAIRGTLWGKETTVEMARYIAQYCRENNLDAVRHVELLGGRIYLTAELYDEKGAPLIMDGTIIPDEPDYINADKRLDKLAEAGDEWAKQESTRRQRARIDFNAPENALAICVQRFRIKASEATIVGVNWCGGGARTKDPVGDSEPTKTAQTRARRRCWKQIAQIIPGYAAIIGPIEEGVKAINDSLPVRTVEKPSTQRALLAAQPTYGDTVTAEAVEAESAPYTGEREPALWHPDVPVKEGELGFHAHKPFEVVTAPSAETKAATLETAKRAVASTEDPYAKNPFDDGPIIYTAPQWCEPCQRTCAKSNDHKGDCMRYAD